MHETYSVLVKGVNFKEILFSRYIYYPNGSLIHIEYYNNGHFIPLQEVVQKVNFIKKTWRHYHTRKNQIKTIRPILDELTYMPSKGIFQGGIHFQTYLQKYGLQKEEKDLHIQQMPQINHLSQMNNPDSVVIEKEAEILPFIYNISLTNYSNDLTCWYNIGRILHQKYKGSEQGLNLWKEFNPKFSYNCKVLWSKINHYMKNPLDYLSFLNYKIKS